MMLLVSVVVVNPSTTAYAETYGGTITANTKTVPYTIPRQIYGYAKDSTGSPLANATVYVSYYSTRYDVPSSNAPIECNYSTVTTDSNGYYSFWAYVTGYYIVFTSQDVRESAYALVPKIG